MKKNKNKIKKYLKKADLVISLFMLGLGIFTTWKLRNFIFNLEIYNFFIYVANLIIISELYYGLSYFIKPINNKTIRIIALTISIFGIIIIAFFGML